MGPPPPGAPLPGLLQPQHHRAQVILGKMVVLPGLCLGIGQRAFRPNGQRPVKHKHLELVRARRVLGRQHQRRGAGPAAQREAGVAGALVYIVVGAQPEPQARAELGRLTRAALLAQRLNRLAQRLWRRKTLAHFSKKCLGLIASAHQAMKQSQI